MNTKEAKRGRVLSGGPGKRCGSRTSTWKIDLPIPRRKETSFCETPKLPWPLDNSRNQIVIAKAWLVATSFPAANYLASYLRKDRSHCDHPIK
jgi:hypothetical protein